MKTLLDAVMILEKALIFIAFVLMAGVLMIDVVGREIVSVGIVGAARMSVFPLAIMAFVAIGLCTATDTHLRPRVFDRVIPARFDPITNTVKELVTAAFCFLVAWAAGALVLESIEYEDKTKLLGWDLWPFQLAFAVPFFLAGMRHVIFATMPALRPVGPIDAEVGEIEDLSIKPDDAAAAPSGSVKP